MQRERSNGRQPQPGAWTDNVVLRRKKYSDADGKLAVKSTPRPLSMPVPITIVDERGRKPKHIQHPIIVVDDGDVSGAGRRRLPADDKAPRSGNAGTRPVEKSHSFSRRKVPKGKSDKDFDPSYIKQQSTDGSLPIKNFIVDQDYCKIKKGLGNGKLFEDPYFPTDKTMLTRQFGGPYAGIEWLRPKDICKRQRIDAPEFYVNATNRFDINQGELGDCWFLSALTNLAEDKESVERVIPPEQTFKESYAGIFRFRFYSFGEWVEIVIDDRLPTRNGELIYIKSNAKNEFWVSLLEKAYAKLYGSYGNLEGGLTIEAGVDFSAGIPEIIMHYRMSAKEKEDLFKVLLKASKNKAYIGSSLMNVFEGTRKGLVERHAYAITEVKEARLKNGGKVGLIRVRNPHGNGREWTGRWHDKDPNWQRVERYDRPSVKEDGEFYMDFKDFLGLFGDIEVVHRLPEYMVDDNKKPLDVYDYKGSWKNSTAGGCGNDSVESYLSNPKFHFTLADPDKTDNETTCDVIITLAQSQNERKKEFPIGFKIFKGSKVTKQDLFKPVARVPEFVNYREVSLRAKLGEGTYTVIPSTFSKGQEADFLLRIFIDSDWSSRSTQATAPSAPVKRADPHKRPDHKVDSTGGGQIYKSTNIKPKQLNHWFKDYIRCK